MGTGDGLYHYYGSWHDDPQIPYASLVGHVAALKDGKDIERPTEELAKERDRLAEEYGALLPEDARPAFQELLGLSRTVFPYVEEHKFYCDYWFQSRFFNKVREFGALLAKHEFLGEAEDVFQLSRHEVMEALEELSLTWSTGGQALGPHHWPPIVARRKELLDKLDKWTPPPALGRMPEAVNDPIVVMLWGITPGAPPAVGAVRRRVQRAQRRGGLARADRGPGAGGARPRRPRHGARRRDPRVHDHLAGLGADLLEDRRDRDGHRRHHVPRRDRLARVRAAGGGGHRHGHGADQDRPAAARGRLHGPREHPRRRRRVVTGAGAQHTRPLTDLRRADEPLFGGKSASLGELLGAGVPVPAGFAVASAADSPELLAEIAAAYEALGDDPAVAVRSSAIGEDSADATFAGQHDTYLWVRGAEAVCAAVRDCWASLENPEAVSYRERLGAAGPPAMGVTVQLMVDALVSGVMFTCNPVSGDPSTVAVNASWGLGSAVVAGEVTPDEYRINKVSAEVTARTIGPKEVEDVPHPDGAGTVRLDVPPSGARPPASTTSRSAGCSRWHADRAPLRLAPGHRVGDLARGGELLVLQSRPVTARPAAKPWRRSRRCRS